MPVRWLPGVLSVPDRRVRSCPPPCRSGSSGTPRRTSKAPTPFGPCILWGDGARLVICGHDRDEERAVVGKVLQGRQVDAAVTIDGDVNDARTVPNERCTRLQDRWVFGSTDEDCVAQALVDTGCLPQPTDREVIRLGRTRREHDLSWVAAGKRGQLGARMLYAF